LEPLFIDVDFLCTFEPNEVEVQLHILPGCLPELNAAHLTDDSPDVVELDVLRQASLLHLG